MLLRAFGVLDFRVWGLGIFEFQGFRVFGVRALELRQDWGSRLGTLGRLGDWDPGDRSRFFRGTTTSKSQGRVWRLGFRV